MTQLSMPAAHCGSLLSRASLAMAFQLALQQILLYAQQLKLPCAGLMASATQPDRALQLPPDLWRKMLLLWRPCCRLDEAPWVAWCRMVTAAASTCATLHTALLGPEASTLWEHICFSNLYPGLHAEQAQGLNRLLAGQAHHARSACWHNVCQRVSCGGACGARRVAAALTHHQLRWLVRPQQPYW